MAAETSAVNKNFGLSVQKGVVSLVNLAKEKAQGHVLLVIECLDKGQKKTTCYAFTASPKPDEKGAADRDGLMVVGAVREVPFNDPGKEAFAKSWHLTADKIEALLKTIAELSQSQVRFLYQLEGQEDRVDSHKNLWQWCVGRLHLEALAQPQWVTKSLTVPGVGHIEKGIQRPEGGLHVRKELHLDAALGMKFLGAAFTWICARWAGSSTKK